METSPRRRPTLRDVARACGVAPSTVSNALADKDIVKPETKQAIRRIALELGYRVSPLASGLRTGKTLSIAMIVSDITNPFHGEVVRGAEETLTALDYHLYVANTDGNRKRQTQYVQHFIDRQVDGLILMSYASNDHDMKALIAAGVPTVLLLRRHSSVDLDFSGIENQQSTAAALRFLWSLGHRRIGFIGGPVSSSGAKERQDAYRQFMMEHIGKCDPTLIDTSDYSIDAGQKSAYRLLTETPRPSALLVGEDMTAYGALVTAAQMQLRVPDDLSVIGWDDLFVSGLPQINLTTMSVPKWQLGVNAAKLLLRRIETPAAEIESRLVRPELIVRGTTSPISKSKKHMGS